MTTLPKFEYLGLPTYVGTSQSLPTNAKLGDVVMINNQLYGCTDEGWTPLYSYARNRSLLFDLYQFLEEYEDSLLKQEILDLLESHRICAYE